MRGAIVLGAGVIGLLSGLAGGTGCFSADLNDCSKYPHAGCPGQGGGGASTQSTGTEGGDGNGGTGAGGAPPGCDPSSNPHPVASSCGIFVSSSMGKDSNGGSQTAPVKTIAHALSLAKGKPVYACAEDFSETVTAPSGSELFGALDCKNGWAYDASKPTHLTAAHDHIPLTLAKGSATTRVSDFEIEAVDATHEGDSSIAVLADEVEAELERCTLKAGAGATGKAGTHDEQTQTPAAADGQSGDAGCTSGGAHAGGDPGANTCGADTPAGGGGGNGHTVTGDPGQPGEPQPMGSSPLDGLPGLGDAGTGCTAGDGGAPGQPGNPGLGATGIGHLTATGYVGPAAASGVSAGTPGQGGGGGGGAKVCGGFNGPGGGGGGAGGCGGAPGGGGKAGGSSIGVLSFKAKLTLTDCTLTTARGGDGGTGGDGQEGSFGGQQGNQGGSGACPGGVGGKGGRGGSGGGGLGGHSVGVAFQAGAAPVIKGGDIAPGTAGSGGPGGDAGDGGQGDGGKRCRRLDLATGTCAS